MATRLFVRSTGAVGSYTVTPAPNHYKNLIGTTFGGSSNGNSVVLAAGASAFSYALNAQFATAIPNFTGTAVGSYRIFLSFQSVTPTNVYSKVRVHRGTLSGTAYTIAASSQWSEERLTNKTVQRWEFFIDQVDLGTWASTNALIVEYNYRNAGASSISPQPTGGDYYTNAIYSPFTTSAAFGYTNQLPVGQRAYNYSQGGIRGTSRYLKPIATANASTGSATGTKGGADFNGTVTGISASSGSIAAGRQGYRGSTTGSGISTGTIAAGRQGYTGAAVGSATSTGIIAAGIQGYSGSIAGIAASNGTAAGTLGFNGSVNGQSTSTGSATGTKGNNPDPIFPAWWLDYQAPKKKEKVQAQSGGTRPARIYSIGFVYGIPGFRGKAPGTIRYHHTQFAGVRSSTGIVWGRQTVMATKTIDGHAHLRTADHDLLVMIGEL